MNDLNNYHKNLSEYHKHDPLSRNTYFPADGDRVIFPEAALPENRVRVYTIEFVTFAGNEGYTITFTHVTEGGTKHHYEKHLDELREIGMRKL